MSNPPCEFGVGWDTFCLHGTRVMIEKLPLVEFQPVSPPHSGLSADHLDHALHVTVMASAGLGLRLHDNRWGP
jgi:hypothetical protein